MAKNLVLWLIIAAVLLMVFQNFTPTTSGQQVNYSQFVEMVQDGQVRQVTIDGLQVQGTRGDGSQFQTVRPQVSDNKLMDDLLANNVEVIGKEPERQSLWTQLLVAAFPILIIIALFVFFMRQMQGGGGGKGPMSFGKSKARLMSEDQIKTTFGDVAGVDEAKEDVKELVDFLRDPSKFQRLGGSIPKGVLMVGQPGTGKTLLAKAIAGEAKVPFFSISGSDFVEMFVGVGASRVRDLFEQAKKSSPCIIFIDEMDAVGRHRGAGIGGGHDEREQTLNALLVEMDGFDNSQNVIVISATNRPDILDPALLRPGRFDRQIMVDVPDYVGRLGILKVHTKKVVMNQTKVDLESLAKGTPGMVGADLANIVNEAALLAARKRKKSVDMDDFEEAKDKVMMGVQRKSMILTDEEKKVTAYHEAGHAMVAIKTKGADPVHKITIIPRGRALGVTMQLPIDEKHGYTRNYVEGRLAILMGGRSAEMLIFNQMTTGAGNDLEQATEIARKMVTEWGMSDLLGPMTFGKKNEEIFLGREIQSHRDYSEVTARMIDEEISRIVRDSQRMADELLQKNIEILHCLAQELLKYETIDSQDLEKILKGEKLTRPLNGQEKPKRKRKRRPKSQNKQSQSTIKSGQPNKQQQQKPKSRKSGEQGQKTEKLTAVKS